MDENLRAPEGATQTVGTVAGLPGYVRFHDQIRDLANFLIWANKTNLQGWPPKDSG